VDLNSAIQFGQLINAAYAVLPDNLANRAGETIQAGLLGGGTSFEVITSIYANDLATDIDPLRSRQTVSIGLILQATTGAAVVALRGTKGIMEWLQDARFLAVPCPFLPGAGNTEDGFTAMYQSLAVSTTDRTSVTKSLARLPWKRPVTSVTICGHSLGGALATLLAVDFAANAAAPFNVATVYTYASPKTGDPLFVSTYNHLVPDTSRIANRMDLVPKLPLPPLYDHVLGLYDLNPIKFGIPPTVLVKCDIPCEHFLNTYLYLLSEHAGGKVLPLDLQCAPPSIASQGTASANPSS
jgi:Lipase (class 3)